MFLVILSAVIIGLFVVLWRNVEYEHPLDSLPGPPTIPLLGAALESIGITPRNLFIKIRNYAQMYGDRYVIRMMHQRVLNIHSVKDMEVVLSHSRNIKKGNPYAFLVPWLGTGLLVSDGAKWHRRRKILTPTFHFNILKSFALVFEEKSRDLVEKLKGVEGTFVDLLPIMSDTTLYAICETAMGCQLDSDKSTASVQYKNSILQIGYIILNRLTNFYLYSDKIFGMLPIGWRFRKNLKIVHSFADNVILERKKNFIPGQNYDEEFVGEKKRIPMLDLLLEAESRGEIDLEGIREEVNTFMFEGHDTTAMALVMTLMLLANDKEAQERVYAETMNILGSDSDRSPTMQEFNEMKYLEAVIKESLRLYPSVPFIARTTSEDFYLDKVFVPKGTEIAIHIYDLQRRADLFPDPEAFRPERFLNKEPMHPYAFVPFSAGPRNCIGQKFAMLEMKYVLSAICRQFTLSPKVQGERPTLLADMLIRPDGPVCVKFTRR